jgi:hypothetical protein
MKTSQVYGGGFLKAEDLAGKTVTVTIADIELKEFEDGKKLIVHFLGKDKALVCNKTNAAIITEITGSDDTDDWTGKRIQLTTRKVEMSGKLVPAIRVVLPGDAPAPPKAEPKPPVSDNDGGPESEDDITF